MKNTLLIALLVASLGLNFWFAFARTGSRPASDATASVGAVNAAGKSSAPQKAAEAARPFVWKTGGTSDAEMRSFVADLRAAGFPPAVIARIVGAVLRDRVYAKVAAMPFWQLNANTREVRRAQMEAGRELQRQLEELLGAAGSQVATFDPNERRERYGDLPDEKVAALLQIERDYQEVVADLVPNNAMTPEESKARRAQFETLETERLADVKAALGDAYADYERQNSRNAAVVLQGLRELQVTEEEYNALFAAQKARNPDDAGMTFSSPPDPATLPATYAFNDQVRAVLGEERAHTFLKSADPSYRLVARFADQQALPPATTY